MQRRSDCRSDYAYINERFQFLTARNTLVFRSAYRTDGVIAKSSVMKYCVSPRGAGILLSCIRENFLFILHPLWKSATSVHQRVCDNGRFPRAPIVLILGLLICKQFSTNRRGKGMSPQKKDNRKIHFPHCLSWTLSRDIQRAAVVSPTFRVTDRIATHARIKSRRYRETRTANEFQRDSSFIIPFRS